MGSATNILTEKIDFVMYTSAFEYIIEFTKEPDILKESLKCSNGYEIALDTHIKKLHGLKTSAGFTWIDCADGWSFKYLGKLNVYLCDAIKERDTIVLFDVFHNGKRVNEPRQKNLLDSVIKYYYPCYVFVEDMLDEGSGELRNNLFFSTNKNAGRVIETDVVELLEGNVA